MKQLLRIACLFLCLVAGAAAEESRTFRMAVLDFASGVPGQPELGKDVASILEILLGDLPGVEMLDRTQLNRTLQEQELSLTGMVDNQQAVRAGKILGARFLVMGRLQAQGDDTLVMAKMVDVRCDRFRCRYPCATAPPFDGDPPLQ